MSDTFIIVNEKGKSKRFFVFCKKYRKNHRHRRWTMAVSVVFERLHRKLAFEAGTIRALALIGVGLMLFDADRIQCTIIFISCMMHTFVYITTDAAVDLLWLLHGLILLEFMKR